jgi:hypothetical protein
VGTLQSYSGVVVPPNAPFAELVRLSRTSIADEMRRGISASHARRLIATPMKKLSLGMAAVLALLSIAGCAQYIGKGKAPPPAAPVVTKG